MIKLSQNPGLPDDRKPEQEFQVNVRIMNAVKYRTREQTAEEMGMHDPRVMFNRRPGGRW